MVYRKTKSTENRKEARRRLLLDSAIKLFGTHGYHATTVPMIVADAESSTGSFYMYFHNKEDVFNAALEELGVTIAALMQGAGRAEPDVLKWLSDRLEATFLYLAQKPEQAHILLVASSGLSPRLDKTRRAMLVRQEEWLRETLESAPDVFAVEDTTIAARCMVGSVFEALHRWLEEDPETRMPIAEVARAVNHFNTKAVKK
jgi:AcrR family transcriptional regulator